MPKTHQQIPKEEILKGLWIVFPNSDKIKLFQKCHRWMEIIHFIYLFIHFCLSKFILENTWGPLVLQTHFSGALAIFFCKTCSLAPIGLLNIKMQRWKIESYPCKRINKPHVIEKSPQSFLVWLQIKNGSRFLLFFSFSFFCVFFPCYLGEVPFLCVTFALCAGLRCQRWIPGSNQPPLPFLVAQQNYIAQLLFLHLVRVIYHFHTLKDNRGQFKILVFIWNDWFIPSREGKKIPAWLESVHEWKAIEGCWVLFQSSKETKCWRWKKRRVYSSWMWYFRDNHTMLYPQPTASFFILQW